MRDEGFFNAVMRAGGELGFSVDGRRYEFGPRNVARFHRGDDGNIYATFGGGKVRMTELNGRSQRWGSLYFSRPDCVDTSDQGL